MTPAELEKQRAWEELCFWRDFAEWSKATGRNSHYSRIQEALVNAEKRFASAVQEIHPYLSQLGMRKPQ